MIVTEIDEWTQRYEWWLYRQEEHEQKVIGKKTKGKIKRPLRT